MDHISQPEWDATPGLTAALLTALSDAGVFRSGGCLLGTLAYRTYPRLLDADLPGAGDAKAGMLAAAPLVMADITSLTPRPWAVIDLFRAIDPSFVELRPDAADPEPANRGRAREVRSTSYINGAGYRVEVLERPRLTRDEPSTFLDYLIAEPVPTTVRHRAEIPVTVPSPHRFAVFMVLVLAHRAAPAAKARHTAGSKGRIHERAADLDPTVARDLAKIATIVAVLAPTRYRDLFEAWRDAFARGPSWEIALALGREILDDGTRALLDGAVRRAGIDAGYE